jgi:hypothetical protein
VEVGEFRSSGVQEFRVGELRGLQSKKACQNECEYQRQLFASKRSNEAS